MDIIIQMKHKILLKKILYDLSHKIAFPDF